MFEKVKMPNHIEHFLATKNMEVGDKMVLHVGTQNPRYQSGIYAVGTIICEPYILNGRPDEQCNLNLTVDVRIDKMTNFNPYMTHSAYCEFDNSFRRVHEIKGNAGEKLISIIDEW